MFKKRDVSTEDYWRSLLRDTEISFLYSFFIDKLINNIKKNYDPFFINLQVVKKIEDIDNTSQRLKINFEEFDENNTYYYEIIDNQFKNFYQMQLDFSKYKNSNFFSLINSSIHKRNFVEKNINSNVLFLAILYDENSPLTDFYNKLSSIINDVFIGCRNAIFGIFKKEIHFENFLPLSLSDYKNISSPNSIFNFFESFEFSFKRRLRGYRKILLEPLFFSNLDLKEQAIFNFDNELRDLLKRYDCFLFQNDINKVCNPITIFESDDKSKYKYIYVSLNLIDLFVYFFGIKDFII